MLFIIKLCFIFNASKCISFKKKKLSVKSIKENNVHMLKYLNVNGICVNLYFHNKIEL